MSGGRPFNGNVRFMRAHDGYLGAQDIEGLCPLRVRVVEIREYVAGTKMMGRKIDENKYTMVHDVVSWRFVDGKKVYGSDTVRGSKEWILNPTNQTVMWYRHGPETTDWTGQHLDLYNEPTKSPKGGGPVWGIRICKLPLEMDHDAMYKLMLSRQLYRPEEREQEEDQAVAVERVNPYEQAASWANE